MKLNLVCIDRHFVRIEAVGEITAPDLHGAAGTAADPLAGLLGADWARNKVVLNLGQVPFLDSSAIGWLITCHREFKRCGGLLVVHSIQPGVRQILDLLKVGKVLTLAKDEAGARAYVEAFGHAA
jgi:anti-anti-sigma factor